MAEPSADVEHYYDDFGNRVDDENRVIDGPGNSTGKFGRYEEKEQDPLDWLSGGTTVNPGAVDTPDLDEEMRVRQKEGEDAEATKWLFDGDLDSAGPNLSDLVVPPKHNGKLDISGRIGKFFEYPGFAQSNATQRAVSNDMKEGIIESVHQGLGGARDAFQEMFDLADELGDWMNENVFDAGTVAPGVVLDPKGTVVQFGPLPLTVFPPGAKSSKETGIKLPNTYFGDAPRTVTGGMIRSISQFLTGFKGWR